MAKGIENRARSPPAVFDFATSQIQKHGGTKMYYDLVESGKRIKALRKEHGLTQEQLAEQLGVAANTIARIETGNRGTPMRTATSVRSGKPLKRMPKQRKGSCRLNMSRSPEPLFPLLLKPSMIFWMSICQSMV